MWTERALQDIEDIAEYMVLDKPKAASKLITRVLSTVERLTDFPESGRILPELPELNYREVLVNPCRIIFDILPALKDEDS
jgi:toxin ParE1/3/4